MRSKIALLLVVLLALAGWPGVGFGSSVQDRVNYMTDKISQFNASGTYSDNTVYSIWTDLDNLPTTGSVSSYVYRDGNPAPTISNFTISPRSIDSGVDKMTRYILGNIANTYRQDPFNTEMTMITYQLTTIPTYVYGDYKSQAVDEIIMGLPNCFSISYDTSSGRSVPTKPIEMPVAEMTLNALFSIGSTTITVNDTSTNQPKTIEMDVAPEIVNDRTYVPVRYLAYALGVPESGVTWDGTTETVTITKDDTTVGLTIGSTTQTVNDEPLEMDVAPYVKEIDTGGRTMLPARWVAEPLGAKVGWDEKTQQVTLEFTKQGQ